MKYSSFKRILIVNGSMCGYFLISISQFHKRLLQFLFEDIRCIKAIRKKN